MTEHKKEFIEVNRVLSGNDKKNNAVEPETISVELIESFRGWHKGPNDTQIDGDMTILVLASRVKEGEDLKMVKKVRTMLIQENYKEFTRRINSKVVIKLLADVID